ncbi:MAG: hypothetical protein IJC58_02200 [Oscillospiraceae bacterium]|nr:hypothetical protein [Oscillospiraceae bacterium]
MSIYRKDPTADRAIGALEREWKEKEKLAKRVRRLREQGLLRPHMEARLRREFTGIYRRLWNEI